MKARKSEYSVAKAQFGRGGAVTMLASCRRLIAVFAVAVLACASAFAVKVSFEDGEFKFTDENGETIGDVTIPPDLEDIVKSRLDEINKALQEHDVDSTTLKNALDKVNEVYDNLIEEGTIKTDKPFTVVQGGLNAFARDLRPTIVNAQTQQNVWAEAWIGQLFPGFHLGAGVNTGISVMDISALKDATSALGIDGMDDFPSTLVFPTITADLRLGGIIFPFDVGFNVMKVNTSTIGMFGADIDPVDFDFFTIGADLRWALIKGKTALLRPRVSVGAGAYYTKGTVGVSDDTAEANLDFSATTFMLNAQASMKVLFLVPFAGVRGLFSKSSVNWNVKADWSTILTDNDNTGLLKDALSWGLLPGNFSGGSSGFSFHPQVYAGLGLDLFVLNITVSGSYDLASQILSAAVSVRIAW